jgi:SAM-dependent methyltransferase
MERRGDFTEEARGFMKSRVILTGAELDFFTLIDRESSSAEEIAGEKGLDPRATARVLDCLTAYGLLRKADGRYNLTLESAPFSSMHPETVLPMLLHMNGLWDKWSRLTGILRKEAGAPQDPGLEMEEKDRKAFIGAMHVVGRDLSREVAGSLDLSRFKRLLDVGGGSGTYTIAFLSKNPGMRGVIFDFENVVSMARERLESEGFLDRVDLVAGDFYHDELPKGCDVALLSAIIHQNSPAENEELYSKIYRALDPGGILLIRDHIMDESRTYPPAGAVFALNMLVNTRGGDTYTFREVRESLERAGFPVVRLLRTGERMDSIIEAQKP